MLHNSKYKPAIGLEIHAELKTERKMFCDCKNDPNETHPNINVCPVCLAHPGTLPVPNIKAIIQVLKLGQALNCAPAGTSHFDRKNYFYPDLPKGYQISQYENPFCEKGYLELSSSKKIRITRVHLEEDTGRLIHETYNAKHETKKNVSGFKFHALSFVDFNRAGVPLLELVTEPDIESAREAKEFGEELQLILRYLGISDADMEKGQMRLEANISVSEGKELGTKVEIKNLNSFRVLEKATEYEIVRQIEELENSRKVSHETRGWDEAKQKTFSQRTKETSADYRYFPEPDIPPFDVQVILNEFKDELLLPELPAQRRKRFQGEYRIEAKETEILVKDKALGEFFESVISEIRQFDVKHQESDLTNLIKLAYNYLISDLVGILIEAKAPIADILIKPEHFAHLIYFIHQGKISSRVAKDVLLKMFETGRDPESIIKEKNLFQVESGEELEPIVKRIISQHSEAVADYEKGKENALQFLIGQIMRETKGKAKPEAIKKILEENLNRK